MNQYVSDALFVHTTDTADLLDRLQNHVSQAAITPVMIDALMADPQKMLTGVDHVVVCGTLETIRAVAKLAARTGFSVGVVPTKTQKELIRFYDLPSNIDAAVDLALRADPMAFDLWLCNGHVALYKAIVGDLPLLDASADVGKLSLLGTTFRRIYNIRLIKYRFATAGERQIITAASGCIIFHHRRMGKMVSRLIAADDTTADGFVSAVISAPNSIIKYLGFLLWRLHPTRPIERLPDAIGCLKSSVIEIEPEKELDVFIDGEKLTRTPVRCEVKASALRVNLPRTFLKEKASAKPAKERIEIDHLPRGKELLKALKNKRIPFFSYASEERYRELFKALREDAQINSIYIMLMVLSTMLAAAGLYLNSSSVIIGAMLLAPLMAPIVSFAMGLTRGDVGMIKKSMLKIVIGMAIALLASAFITQLFPDKPVTGEMQARLNPSLLDLAVAIISGIAGAYSKSFKEIIQSLAGVAIAVALVPPLAVAGTGIGRGDFQFFFQAFLLFSTNLVGIIIAAALTFRVLGYSPAIYRKRGLVLVFLLLALIAVPLYTSYERIVDERILEKRWTKERFLVNGKYVIVDNADLRWQGGKKVLIMEVILRDLMTREDMKAFNKKLHIYFPGKMVFRIKTVYIP